MSILIMPDHGTTVYLDDEATPDAVYSEIRRLFKETACGQITVATRTHASCETCVDQIAVGRDTIGRADIINQIAHRVAAHVAYENPLADPVADLEEAVAKVVAQDVHPTLHVPYDAIAAPYTYHLGCALISLLGRDYPRVQYHLDRQREIDAVAD